MKENRPFDALFDADDQTISRIAAQCPAEWDENDVFERSYRKYQAERSGKSVRRPRRFEIQPLRALVTAACLMIAVGGAGSIWFFRYGVNKPQMTVDVEHAPTESTTSASETTTTAEDAVKSKTTTASTSLPETVYIVPESVMELHTTAAVTSPVPASTTSAVTSAVTASNTIPAATAAQQHTTAATRYVPETALRHETQTAPAQTTAVQTTAVQDTRTTETEPASDAAGTGGNKRGEDTASPAVPIVPDHDPEEPSFGNVSGDVQDPIATVGGSESGFSFTDENGWSKVSFRPDVVIPIEKAEFSIDLPGYTLEETDSRDAYSRLFRIQNPDTGDNCQLRHYSYSGFQGSYKLDSMVMREVEINGRPGYLVYPAGEQPTDSDGNDNLYTLFWDDGTGISMISDVDAGGKNMMKIAASVTATIG